MNNKLHLAIKIYGIFLVIGSLLDLAFWSTDCVFQETLLIKRKLPAQCSSLLKNETIQCAHGECDIQGNCICDDDYSNYDRKPDEAECMYKLKSKLKAFLISLFIGGFGKMFKIDDFR